MSMFGVVPREERSAVAHRVVDVVVPMREAGVALQGLELCLRNGLSSETRGRVLSAAGTGRGHWRVFDGGVSGLLGRGEAFAGALTLPSHGARPNQNP
jgi:hypothetical protein